MPTASGIQESKEVCLCEDVLMCALRMWLICRRATGKQARIGREVAQQFARSLSLLAKGMGEEEFKVKYPQIYYEMSNLIVRV